MEMTQISDLALSDSVLYWPICLFVFFFYIHSKQSEHAIECREICRNTNYYTIINAKKSTVMKGSFNSKCSVPEDLSTINFIKF